MPIRETPLHREAQGAIIREWLEATGFHYTALPLPPFSELDERDDQQAGVVGDPLAGWAGLVQSGKPLPAAR